MSFIISVTGQGKPTSGFFDLPAKEGILNLSAKQGSINILRLEY
jgi:hypothetical protein